MITILKYITPQYFTILSLLKFLECLLKLKQVCLVLERHALTRKDWVLMALQSCGISVCEFTFICCYSDIQDYS